MRGDEKGAVYGEVRSVWTNRVQPANSKGGNWWQSPLCGAHTDRHFRESRVMRKHLVRGTRSICGTERPGAPCPCRRLLADGDGDRGSRSHATL
jgi:hypothetical protein